MQEHEILRYNQGFGNFGLMEQCTDGKFTLAEDTDHLQYRIDRLKADLEAADNRERLLRKDNIELRHSAASRVRRLSIDLKYSRRMNRVFAAIAMFGLTINIVLRHLP